MLFRKKVKSVTKRNKKSSENTLFAGPWIGEFGWELFCWQGYLRTRSCEFDRVIISSRPDMEPLYADFCDEFIPYTPNGPGVSGYKNTAHKEWPDISDQRPFREYISGNFYIGFNRSCPAKSSNAFMNQVFFKYGTQKPELSYDVVLHIRQTNKKNSGWRNGWSLDVWQAFLEELQKTGTYKICCIGDPNGSGMLAGCDDRRGLPMNELFDLLASSRVLAGPSSGPMHLGALCGCPHVVWSGEHANQPKYEKFWNPFSTPVEYIHDDTWTPAIHLPVTSILKMMETTR